MIGPSDLLLGGLAPLVAASAAFALAWLGLRRAGAAWSAGVVAGYAVGSAALEAHDSSLRTALASLVRATESHEWIPLMALAGAAPLVVGHLTGRRWAELVSAAAVCVGAPAWLLWRKYTAGQQLRDLGLGGDDAITAAGATAVILGIAAASCAAWWLWLRADQAELPKVRAGLAIVAAVGAAATAALTGSLVYGQALGVLAASLGGCAAAGWMLGVRAGPEAARGPALVAFGGLLAVAVVYSEMRPVQAAALAAAFVLPVGWLPALATRRLWVQALARIALCVVPVAIVVSQAGAKFAADQQFEENLDAFYSQ